MPRAERVQKEATKKLKKLGEASGQTRISGCFSSGTLQPINEEDHFAYNGEQAGYCDAINVCSRCHY